MSVIFLHPLDAKARFRTLYYSSPLNLQNSSHLCYSFYGNSHEIAIVSQRLEQSPPRISTCWVNEWRFPFHMHFLSLGSMVRKPCFLFLFLSLRNVWRKWTLIALSRLAQYLELTFFEPMWFTQCKEIILLSLGLGLSEKRQPSDLVGLWKCTFLDSALKGFRIRKF